MTTQSFVSRRQIGHLTLGASAFVLMSKQRLSAADKPITFDAPASVTCIGQNVEGEALQQAIIRAGVEPHYEQALDAKDLGDTKSLFLTISAAPGIDAAAELARANRLIDQCAKDNILIIIVQIGGKPPRDAISEQLIKAIVPKSNVIIVIPETDSDGLFNDLAQASGIPIRSARSKVFLPELIKAAFGSGT